MTRGISTLLASPAPCTAAPARVTIGHIQLRDVLICPHERGIVTYPQNCSIVEHDLAIPNSVRLLLSRPSAPRAALMMSASWPQTPRRLADLEFIPNSLSALTLPDSGDTLLAAGGQEAELHLSYYSSSSSSQTSDGRPGRARGFGRKQWESKYIMDEASINNSVLLTSLSLTGSHESSAEPRVVVSNNDRTVKFFDVAVRVSDDDEEEVPRLSDVGQLHLEVPINHSSISPDGRTLLCVGDSPDVYLHRVTGGARITFAPIAKLSLSPYLSVNPYLSYLSTSTVPASFSTAFSSDGSKFAVASQEGVVAIWDVRSTKPLKIFHTDQTRPSGREGNGGASGWLYESPWDWTNSGRRAPGWGVRSIKFSPAGVGREVMTFTEHTSLLHVIDARTFDKEEIVRVPNFDVPAALQPFPSRRSSSPSRQSPPYATPDPPPPPPPRIVLFSGALEDTFRIPSADSDGRWRPRSDRDRRRGQEEAADEDVDSIIVIPPLGDREVENDVRRLLGQHGLHSRSITLLNREASENDGEGAGEEMEVDELESDCFSSHTPSRASSPVPPAASASTSQLSLQPSATRPLELLRLPRPSVLARRESTGPYATHRMSAAGGLARRHRRSGQLDAPMPDVDQDLAGTCFDPSGAFVYVASVKGVAEWKVRGAEQRWWTDPGFL
ncbi:hypothetical protein BKA93DRAFT_810665 [Sparassis latifolia]